MVSALATISNDDVMIQTFADRFMEWQAAQRGSAVLSGLEARLRKNETAIRNAMNLIDSGFVTESLKSHIIELEAERVELEVGIVREKMETPELERPAVVWFLEQFRDGDPSDVGWCIFIVETFLQAAFLYDDGRLLLHLNFSGKESRITVQLAEQAVSEGDKICSYFAPCAAPAGGSQPRARPTSAPSLRGPYISDTA